jgi:HEAT repeat protein
MADKNIIDKIKNKEWDAVQDAKSIEGEPDDSIIQQASDNDVEVRELTLFCLNEIGGEKAIETFVRSLKDSEEDIRSRAVKFLHEHHSDKVLPELLNELKENQDYYVREQVALIIGKIDEPSAVPDLKKRYKKEGDEIVMKNISLAMARLKDEDSQKVVLDNLQEEEEVVKVRYQALMDFEYINDKDLVNNLLPLLDDTRDAKNVAPAGHEYFIRVCDVTINVLNVVLDQPFEFSAGELRRYTSGELKKAKSVVKKKK